MPDDHFRYCAKEAMYAIQERDHFPSKESEPIPVEGSDGDILVFRWGRAWRERHFTRIRAEVPEFPDGSNELVQDLIYLVWRNARVDCSNPWATTLSPVLHKEISAGSFGFTVEIVSARLENGIVVLTLRDNSPTGTWRTYKIPITDLEDFRK